MRPACPPPLRRTARLRRPSHPRRRPRASPPPNAVATLLHVAADRGITRARLALRPAELGGVEVQLSSTAAGITARLVADSGEERREAAPGSRRGEHADERAASGRTGDGDGDGASADAEAASDPVH